MKKQKSNSHLNLEEKEELKIMMQTMKTILLIQNLVTIINITIKQPIKNQNYRELKQWINLELLLEQKRLFSRWHYLETMDLPCLWSEPGQVWCPTWSSGGNLRWNAAILQFPFTSTSWSTSCIRIVLARTSVIQMLWFTKRGGHRTLTRCISDTPIRSYKTVRWVTNSIFLKIMTEASLMMMDFLSKFSAQEVWRELQMIQMTS